MIYVDNIYFNLDVCWTLMLEIIFLIILCFLRCITIKIKGILTLKNWMIHYYIFFPYILLVLSWHFLAPFQNVNIFFFIRNEQEHRTQFINARCHYKNFAEKFSEPRCLFFLITYSKVMKTCLSLFRIENELMKMTPWKVTDGIINDE